MSTKIYNAFKFKGTQEELMPFLHLVRNNIENDTIEYYQKMPEIKKLATFDLLKKFREAKQNGFFEYNLDSSVVVYFHSSGIYLQFFYPGHFGRSDKGFPEKWSEYIEDFHYQNQADKPEDISDEDWKKREEIWDDIFPSYTSSPSKIGLIWEINNDEWKIVNKILL